jgi:hypothetical protein
MLLRLIGIAAVVAACATQAVWGLLDPGILHVTFYLLFSLLV